MGNNLTLAITQIGDLLLNNRITQNEEGFPIENISLKIPEYQRPYKWTAKNANQLLDDIDEARKGNKEVYRVGTLILHHDKEKDEYNIVDGQQRTITFSLLLKSLSDENQVAFLDEKLAGNSYNLHNVYNNYRSLKKRVRDIGDERKDLSDFIKSQCELIVVITDDLSEAFQFFDSQNARGKELYPHDLLKAYHLREMSNIDVTETENIVKVWEDLDQRKLSMLFKDYLYRLKEWVKGSRAGTLSEHNIDIFKGVSVRDNYPYAQFYKGAFSYADNLNKSSVPFVTGVPKMVPFQINTPIIAGKPFFEYTKHYFDILADIQNNDKYEGYFVNDNEIVKTLDLKEYKSGVGNNITRLLFDTAILLYVDRFCKEIPEQFDLKMLDLFIERAFIWAYSMRAQYVNVGWQVAQNYVMGEADARNSFNIFKLIVESDTVSALLNELSDRLMPIKRSAIRPAKKLEKINDKDDRGIYINYLHFFEEHYLEDK